VKHPCRCGTCREFGAFYQGRVLFWVTRDGEELHVGVDELTSAELACFSADGASAEKDEITDWLSEPCPAPMAVEEVAPAYRTTTAHAA
jgi:hypothetical protein